MLEPFQERVKKEKNELDQKITKLNEFLASDATRNVSLEDMRLLSDQYFIMKDYSSILGKRISRF